MSGGCVTACPAPLTKCGSGPARKCTNTDSDNNNCGVCGTVCPAGQGCSNGQCVNKFPLGAAMNKALVLRMGQMHAQRYIPMLLDRLAAGEIDPGYLATHPVPLTDGVRGYEIFEKDDDIGGNCRSVRRDGHTFDRTGHWLHMRNDYTRQLVEKLMPGELVAVSRKAQIFTHQAFLGFPFQSNTFGLPPEVNKECLLGFIQARETRGQRAEPVNFEQWILHQYGEGIARHFMIPYNSKLYGRHPIAAEINESRTWEGLAGSAGTTALVGAALYWATPFQTPWQSGLMSLLIAVMGFAGGMTMSAIKRDRGVKDYGTLVEGHGGVLDRIDSVCFAAPVFYHVTRYLFSVFPE